MKMTLEDLIACEKDMLTPAEISGVIGSSPQTIRVTAHQRPEKLGFPVSVTGKYVRIPRIPFLRFMGVNV